MKSIINLGFLGIGLFLLAGCAETKRDLKPEEIWSLVSPSVVRVEAKSLEGETMVGSGFVCELQGKKFILSNRHVVLGAKEVRVGSSENTLALAPSYRISPELDLALIDLPAGWQIAPLKTRTGGLKIGERVFAIGFPLGLNKSITQGLVSSETEQLAQFDASISSGNSGGPLVDKDGAALGVVTAGSKSSGDEITQNLNFAIKTAFVPKAELFKEPIVRFYDAWRELVKVENKLIADLQELRVFDVETCVQAGMALPFLYALDKEEMKNLDPEKKMELETFLKASCADELARVIQRHGSLGAGVKSVVAFLRSKVSEFDKVPELFAGLGSDDLLRSFGRDEREITLFKWDIKPSEIVPLLKVSIEFAKAKYEDKAFQIEFGSQVPGRLQNGDTNIIVAMQKVETDAECLGSRTTVRLPYDRLGGNCKVEDRVRMYFLCDQQFGHRAGGRWMTGLKSGTERQQTMTERISEYGGFEGLITSMFVQRAQERIALGDFERAIQWQMNEVEVKKYPDLGHFAFLHVCKGDFEKAFGLYAKAYEATLDKVDPFDLTHDNSELRQYLLRQLYGLRFDKKSYPERVLSNLANWERFTKTKPAFSLTELPLVEAIGSPLFRDLSEFEKCWVLDFAIADMLVAHDMDVEPMEWLPKFEDAVKVNPDAFKLYQRDHQRYLVKK